MVLRPVLRFLLLGALAAACVPGAATSPAGVSPVETAESARTPTAEVVSAAELPGYDPAGYDPDPGGGFVPLDDPAFLLAAEASHLAPDEFVLGVEWNGEARAYPVAMMAYHHIANDAVRGSPILVTY